MEAAIPIQTTVRGQQGSEASRQPDIEPFMHLPEYPFVFCKTCKSGFVASEVLNHLKNKHGHISRKDMQRIKQTIAACMGVARDQAELRGWASPPPTIRPNPHIQPPQEDGLGCNDCPYVVRDMQQMQKHYREQHGWVNHRKRGGQHTARRQGQPQPVPWRSGVPCQRICHWGHGKRWFEVGRPEMEEQGGPSAADGDGFKDAVRFAKRIYREDQEAFKSETEARVQDANDKWEAERWLNRCGWARHLEGIERDRLRAVLQPIGEDEPVLQQMWEIFEGVLDRAYAAANQCYPGTAELFEIERKEAHVTTTKPFQGLMEPDAWERYKAWWRTLMSIWKRLESWGSEDGDGSDGGGSSSSSSEDGISTSISSSEDGIGTGSSTRHDGGPPRPPYRMTIRQEELWKSFDEGVTQVVNGTDSAGRYTPERLQRSCLDAVVQFLDHPFGNGNHYENIIISALAVMGLEREGGGWVPVMNYTPIYSAVIKVARYLVLYQSILERHGQKTQLQQYMSAREADEQAEGLFRIVRRKVRQFMTRVPEGEDVDPTPMNWIINTRTYGMRIRFTTPGSETIDWRGNMIVCGRVRLEMTEISDILHNLVIHARKTLVRLATGNITDEEKEVKKKNKRRQQQQQGAEGMGEEEEDKATFPRIPWSRIEDRHGESALEHSFLSDEHNEPWVKTGEEWVHEQITASPVRFKAWMAEPLDEQCPYRETAIRAYGRAIEEFRGQMFVLMHMLGGQPARATEILGLRMWNTANGGVRNIFIHEGMVCFVAIYHKGFRQTGNIKVIHRYLPREVGELLVWYMWLVLPFWQAVQGRMKQKRRRSAFLWADEVVSEHGGKERKGGFTSVRAAGSAEGGGEEAREREEEAAFMEWFREPKWTSDRVRRLMQRYSTQFSGQEVNISTWRQMAIGISNRYFNKVFGAEDDEFEDEDGDGGLVDSIHDLQAGHGSHIAGLIYARLFGQGELGTMRSREEFRKVSMQWHRFFGFGAEDRIERGLGAGIKRVRSAFDAEREEMQRKRFGKLHRMDVRGQLKQMMGPAAEFRGLQEPVIRAVARGEWPIVQITPTGGGKSLTFMLPAFCVPDGITIVITPLVALENDMDARCAKMGINAYVWTSRGVQRAASLVFVTPESAVTKGFRTFVERMHGQQKLDRVVVDECHTMLQYSKTFRPQIGRLGEALQDFGVPVVCLTATLKPTQEKALFKELKFNPDRVRMFREATTRRNIQYRVDIIEDGNQGSPTARKITKTGQAKRAGRRSKVSREGEEEGEEDNAIEQRVCEIVRAWTAAHSHGKVIIYGGTIKRVERIAAALGCMAYWRGVGNAEEKARRIEEWRMSEGGESGWIAATNALGMGIDDPNVRLVVHGGIPRQLVNLAQESGRGGRDGQKSESVVVIRRSWLEQQLGARARKAGEGAAGTTAAGTTAAATTMTKQQQERQQEREREEAQWAWDDDVVEFAEGKCCRREVLDREMDGSMERFGCIEGEELCDVCCRQQVERDMQELAEMDGFEFDDEEKEGIRGEQEEEEAAEADYQRSQRTIRQVETERTLQVMRETQEVSDFEDMLAQWDGCCIACMVKGRGDTHHSMDECPRKGSSTWDNIKQGIEAVQREMFTKRRFARFAACYECGLPQAVCRQWEAASDDARLFRRARAQECQYKGLLIGIFVAQRIRALDTWAGDIGRMMGSDEVDIRNPKQMAGLYEWLGELVEWGGRAGGGIQASRMCQVVIQMNGQ